MKQLNTVRCPRFYFGSSLLAAWHQHNEFRFQDGLFGGDDAQVISQRGLTRRAGFRWPRRDVWLHMGNVDRVGDTHFSRVTVQVSLRARWHTVQSISLIGQQLLRDYEEKQGWPCHAPEGSYYRPIYRSIHEIPGFYFDFFDFRFRLARNR